MSLYSSCNHYRTICSSVKRLTSPFCSCHQWRWICSTAIILFLLSVQDNLQKRQKAWRFGPLKAVGLWCHHSVLAISEGDSAVMPWFCSCQLWQWICRNVVIVFLQSLQDNLQQCRYILLASTTGEFAAMMPCWRVWAPLFWCFLQREFFGTSQGDVLNDATRSSEFWIQTVCCFTERFRKIATMGLGTKNHPYCCHG